MGDAEIYARQLLGKRHGYPLWRPEPFDYSNVYKSKGVRVGDVGYVTQDGDFETLFNIRASASDPINSQGVPTGFEQVELEAKDIAHKKLAHSVNGTVASFKGERRAVGIGASAGLVPTAPVEAEADFECSWSTTEGAILHLPQGASRLECKRKKLFIEQALKHAHNWYKFATVTLQRHISYDALYLVTGCDKTTDWMVGTFSEVTSNRHAVLRATAASVAGARVSYHYSWTSCGPAVHRVGPPSDDTLLEIDEDELQRDDEMFSESAPEGRNQCVFIKGVRISSRKRALANLLGVSPQVQLNSVEDSQPEEFTRGGRNSRSSKLDSTLFPWGTKPPKARSRSADVDYGDKNRVDSMEISLSMVPEELDIYHPATVINQFLLGKFPDKDVAVTLDDVWIDLLGKDCQIPADNQLLEAFMSRYTPSLLHCGVFAEERTDHTTSTQVSGGIQEMHLPDGIDLGREPSDVHLSAAEIKRQKIVDELLQTERVYVDGLEVVFEHFWTPITASLDTPDPLLDRASLDSLFSNFVDILDAHRSFLADFMSLLASAESSSPPPLSPILLRHFSNLDLYSQYVTAFPSAIAKLDSLVTPAIGDTPNTAYNSMFTRFLTSRQEGPLCGRLHLRDWLLTVVQRCPRYILLLRELISITDPDDSEHAQLTAAQNMVSQITESFNASLSRNRSPRSLQALPFPPTDKSAPKSMGNESTPTEVRRSVDQFIPAIWVPDEKVNACMRCEKPFGWRRRRHHCRICGRCVCASCSERTFYIFNPHANDPAKPARACTACYETVFPVVSLSDDDASAAPGTSLSILDTRSVKTRGKSE